ncbi:hypothetical protein Halha_1260 [Halobacteroides halobius DSM 5150]|uniref:Cobalamin biosynthesis protein CbiX n=1 Tax=Halobacteroides halobius (strain ATCC 35273 / DSM 5150 / MD-1) TaxID=748449 RepID=L0K856_HALHC|nr:CbiX/SirB N-terminal domain-containing protein [Halobacteroides halobius]AGB41206.1 hypothetical protein Halha_1260 [Halobacteroides halobius DSM 5150]
MKQGVILLGHGSRSTAAQQELSTLSSQLKKEISYPIEEANLELTKPNFWDAAKKLINQGINKIIIVPLFLFTGYHVSQGIPRLIADAKDEYPEIDFQLTSHLAAETTLFKEIIKEKIDR